MIAWEGCTCPELKEQCSGASTTGMKELSMKCWALRAWLILLVIAGIWGCASMAPERKMPVDSPRINEEDVTEEQAGQTRGGSEERGPVSPEVSPAAPDESPSQPMDPGSRPPRRLKFRDRGMDKTDRSIRKAGTIGSTECLVAKVFKNCQCSRIARRAVPQRGDSCLAHERMGNIHSWGA
jgi:hypothetical protein